MNLLNISVAIVVESAFIQISALYGVDCHSIYSKYKGQMNSMKVYCLKKSILVVNID